MDFPQGFVWGTAAASYQIEGGAYDDGKGLSVWDMFCRKPGAVWNNHTGEVACDHYHRYREDVSLMAGLGIQAYRLSISWPRLLPEGTGRLNPAGVDFYNRLVDALLEAGITPYVTLFHWDYPYELYCRGGWLNPSSPDWFADFAQIVAGRLGDRVRHWMTLNEPQCFVALGHADGVHAPGDKLGLAQVLRVGHNALLAHGKAVQAIRAASPGACQVGMAPMGAISYPLSSAPADIDAARTGMFSMHSQNLWNNAWWMDPVYLGRYPEDGLAAFGKDAPQIGPDDLKTIHQPLDFFGINLYNGQPVRAGANGLPEQVELPQGFPQTANRWPLTPDVLYWGPRFFYERYHLPVYIYENGMSGLDWVAMDGKVHDPQRIDFTRRYLLSLRQAGQDGVPLAGYFHWSFMDNFEWGEGYKERFGLVYVDYATQQRIPKDSARWYSQVIASNGKSIDN